MGTEAPAAQYEGLREQAAGLAALEISPPALLERTFDRIDAVNAELGAFRVLRRERAWEEAAEADRRLRAGERAPLLGVPIAVKDDTDVLGESTPFGCGGDLLAKEEDAILVGRLRAAGAIVVGKTTTPELGQWPFTEGPGFGAARNPYDTTRTPGGSSGGSAAAVAAGLVAGAVGSDGAGSVRIPAAWCGLVGIKPTRDRIPTGPEGEWFHGLTCHGPLTRSVDDAALLLDVLADTGTRYADAAAREPGRLRIGVSFATPWIVPGKVHPEVRAAVRRLAAVLAELGHEVVDTEPDHRMAGLLFLPRGTNGVRRALAAMGPDASVERRTREHAFLGGVLGGPVVAGAKRAESWLAGQMSKVYERVDVLLAPTTAKPALRIGQFDGKRWLPTSTAIEAACPFAFPWNVVGWPGINVPAGTDSQGVPLGAQLLGRDDDEERLLSLAAQLEQVERWDERRPPAYPPAV
jgi:amidase